MLAVLGSAHYYVWVRLVRDTHLPPGIHRTLTWLIIALFVLLPLTFLSVRTLNAASAKPLFLAAFSWLGLLLFLVSLLLLGEIARVAVELVQRLQASAPEDPQRRMVLSRL